MPVWLDIIMTVIFAPLVKILKIITGIAYRKYQWTVFASQHHLVAHSMKEIAIKLDTGGFDSLTRKDFNPLAKACCESLAAYLNKDSKQMNCTIKFCCPRDPGNGQVEVKTMGRSNHQSRPPREDKKKHYINDNTTFCALLGKSDGITDWQYCLPYFYCANLAKRKDKFKCSRIKFLKYYKTSMVFPLRVQDENNEQPTVYGFLTFDSNKTKMFKWRGLLDTKRFQDDPNKLENDWTECVKSVEYSTLVNFCGSMADNITSVLYPHIQERGIK